MSQAWGSRGSFSSKSRQVLQGRVEFMPALADRGPQEQDLRRRVRKPPPRCQGGLGIAVVARVRLDLTQFDVAAGHRLRPRARSVGARASCSRSLRNSPEPPPERRGQPFQDLRVALGNERRRRRRGRVKPITARRMARPVPIGPPLKAARCRAPVLSHREGGRRRQTARPTSRPLIAVRTAIASGGARPPGSGDRSVLGGIIHRGLGGTNRDWLAGTAGVGGAKNGNTSRRRFPVSSFTLSLLAAGLPLVTMAKVVSITSSARRRPLGKPAPALFLLATDPARRVRWGWWY